MKRYNYTKTNWIDGKTIVDARRLNKIEEGLSVLYENALGNKDLQEGTGIKINDETIEVDDSVVLSDTISGIEFSIGEPREIDPGKLYLVLKEDKTLDRIILGGITIFNNA